MPRVYKHKEGTKRLKEYSDETLENCLSEVLDGKISANQASIKYKIPKGTLINKIHGRHIKKHGGQTVFTKTEEDDFVDGLITCAKWGFPLNTLDLRLSAKAYLDRIGKNSRFKNNFPGYDWAKAFLERHKYALSERLSNNIKRSRAAVDAEMLTSFFDELSKTLAGVRPESIFNYDESNLSDDPGKKKLIFHRGVKYPDNVINFSKSAVTIMLCVSAAGDMLPPYVVYKAANLWDSWREGGPRGAPCCEKKCCARGTRYNRSNHGWFDTICFTDWFKTTFLPHAKLIEGKTVLIGDNLSSHFTKEVLQLCKENNIDFVCLPPNATHLCQPLDVSFFGPMKNYWKQLLQEWRKCNPSTSSVEKSIFPRLLKKLFDKMAPTAKKNAQRGFYASGIFPLSKQKLLDKIPHKKETPKQSVGEVIVDYLKEQRNPKKRDATTKRKKLNVVPGRSVAFEDTPERNNEEGNIPSTSKIQSVKRKIVEESEESSETEIELDEETDQDEENNVLEVEFDDQEEEVNQNNIKPDSWVVVEYQTKKTVKHFIGKVVSVNKEEVNVNFLKRSKTGKFIWPEVEDQDDVAIYNIKKLLDEPKIYRRGELSFDFDMSIFNFM